MNNSSPENKNKTLLYIERAREMLAVAEQWLIEKNQL